jgi:hypothetical protein
MEPKNKGRQRSKLDYKKSMKKKMKKLASK